jgi:hypothetical protein
VRVFKTDYQSGKEGFSEIAKSESDDRGRYRIFGVPAGSCYLSAVPAFGNRGLSSDSGSYLQTFFPGVLDFSQATAVEVDPGTELENTNFKLSRIATVRVRGQITNLQAASVSLFPIGAVPFAHIYSVDAANGKFEFKSVPAGEYNLAVLDSSSMRQHPRWVRQALTLGNADIDGIAVTLPPSASIDGRIIDEGGSRINWSEMGVRVEPVYPNNVTYGRTAASIASHLFLSKTGPRGPNGQSTMECEDTSSATPVRWS